LGVVSVKLGRFHWPGPEKTGVLIQLTKGEDAAGCSLGRCLVWPA
jgi:hypothetical protein